MKKISWITFFIFFSFIFKSYYTDNFSNRLKWTKDVGAKKFPNVKKVYLANDFGAIGDGYTINTEAIQKAIDFCHKNGGGIIKFLPGKYITGSIFLKDNIVFQVDSGVYILGSEDIKDYREIFTRVAGIEMMWPAALINVLNKKNVAIIGKGVIDGRGKVFWDKYWAMRREYEPKNLRWIVDYDCKRPRLILVDNSENVTIKDLHLKEPGFWTVHILYSKHVTVDGLIIRNNISGKGPSTDGIDIDSSSKILVQNCDVDCNDDNYCIKAGRDADGLRVNRPCEYVVIKNCISRKGGGLITLGSETSGGIRNIYVRNMKAYGTSSGIRIKSAKNRGGTVENIFIEDLFMDSVSVALNLTLNWNPSYSYSSLPDGYSFDSIPYHWKVMLQPVDSEKGLPKVKNIYVNNIKAVNINQAVNVQGLENSIPENFVLNNIEISAKNAGRIENARNWIFNNFKLVTLDNSNLELINSFNIIIN